MLALGAVGVLVLWNEQSVRLVEARVAAWALSHTFADTVFSFGGSNPGVSFHTGKGWAGLMITPECSIAFYVGPLLLLAAIVAAVPRLSVWRVATAVLIGSAGLFLLNEVRFLALGWVLSAWGMKSFEWWHSLGGSFLMLTGLAGTLGLFFALAVRERRAHRHDRTPRRAI